MDRRNHATPGLALLCLLSIVSAPPLAAQGIEDCEQLEWLFGLEREDALAKLESRGFEVVRRTILPNGDRWSQATRPSGDSLFLLQGADSIETRALLCREVKGGRGHSACLAVGGGETNTTVPAMVTATCPYMPVCGCPQPASEPEPDCAPLSHCNYPRLPRVFSTRFVLTWAACEALFGADCNGSIPQPVLDQLSSHLVNASARLRLSGVCSVLDLDPAAVELISEIDESQVFTPGCALAGFHLLASSTPAPQDVSFFVVSRSGWKGVALQQPASPGTCTGALVTAEAISPNLLAHEFGHLLGANHEGSPACPTSYAWAQATPGSIMESGVGDTNFGPSNVCAANHTVERFWRD